MEADLVNLQEWQDNEDKDQDLIHECSAFINVLILFNEQWVIANS